MIRMQPSSSPHAAVCGLQWGDEGKGKIVDLLTADFDVVVRYNGGANAGHSVEIGDERYALHLLPSGILSPGKINVIANGVVLDPMQLISEIDGMKQRGVQITDNLRISSRAHLVMPYHKLQDALLEGAVSASRGDHKKIGTTGRGIGPAYSDKMQRSTGIRAGDLLDPARFTDKLRHICAVKNAMLAPLAQMAGEDWTPINHEPIARQYLDAADRLGDFICDTTALLHDAADAGKKLLFEGANGSMLDIDHGTYPYVTSSNCGTIGVYAGSGMPGGTMGRVVGIMKAYTTRVGAGPFATELEDEAGDRIRNRGNEFGTTTGRPRRCGWPDLAVVKYTAAINGVTELAVMLLDVLAGLDPLKVCTGYRLAGREISAFPEDAAALSKVEPIYQTLDGFAEEVTRCTAFDALPAGARAYIELIEQTVGVPVSIISVGPKRSQTIHRD